jgi:hypothetical protein
MMDMMIFLILVGLCAQAAVGLGYWISSMDDIFYGRKPKPKPAPQWAGFN